MPFRNLTRVEVLLLFFLIFLVFVFSLIFYRSLFYTIPDDIANNSNKTEISSDVKPTVAVNIDWQKYFFKEYGLTFYYPKSYFLDISAKDNQKRFNFPTVILKNKNGDSTLYIGDSAVFSTSSDLCNPYKCEESDVSISTTELKINSEDIFISPIRRYFLFNEKEVLDAQSAFYEGKIKTIVPKEDWRPKDYVFQFMLGAFLQVQPENKAFVTANYTNRSQEEEIFEIIKTISW